MSENRPYTRGMYYRRPAWTKDDTYCYYQGIENKIYWPAFKYAALVVVYFIFHSML